MKRETYNSKVDWWVPAIVIFSVAYCMAIPMIFGDLLPGILLSLAVLAIELLIFTGIKYEIRGDQLGIRSFFHWQWYPIGKITEARKKRGVLSAAALSYHRIAIRFSDRSILKSALPLEISPKERDAFLARLKEINPDIKTGT